MTLTILFAFLGLMTFAFIVSGLFAFHRKLYDKASTTLFIAVLAMMTFSFIDFIGLLDGRFPDTPTWVKVCDIAECVFLSVLATIACYREHPKDKLQEAKNAVAAELGDYVRPYFHQMKRVIWKLRKQKAYDSVQICRNNRLELERLIEHSMIESERTTFKEHLAMIMEQERKWIKCVNKIKAYMTVVNQKYNEIPDKPLIA